MARFTPPSVDLAKLLSGLELLKDEVTDVQHENVPDSPSIWWKLTHLQPALYAGAVTAMVAVLGAFGFIISDNQTGAIVSVVTFIIGLVQAVWTHSKVVPSTKVVVYKPDPVDNPSMVVAGPAVSSDVTSVANAASSTPGDPQPVIPVLPVVIPRVAA